MNPWLAFALILIWAAAGTMLAARVAARFRRNPDGDPMFRADWNTGLMWAFAFALALAGWIAAHAG